MDANNNTQRNATHLATPDEISAAGTPIDGVFDQALWHARKLARAKKNTGDATPLVGILEGLQKIHADMTHVQVQVGRALDRADVRAAVQLAIDELAAADEDTTT